MKKIDGGSLLAQALKREGVTHIFTLAGGHIMPILYACRDLGIKIIDVRHEATAIYAADAFARVSGRPGVAITTAGPGVMHTVVAMAEARDTGVPLIHIGGASPLSEKDTGPLQEGNTLEVMAAVSTWARGVYQTHRLPEYLAMAFRQAGASTPGPVYLEIPVDVLAEEIETKTVSFPRDYRVDTLSCGAPSLVEKAARMLVEAKRPAILLGNNARFSIFDPSPLAALADHLKMPVFSQTLCRGLCADEETDLCFSFGPALPVMAEADLVLMLGVKNDYLVSKGQGPFFNPVALRIQVHPDPILIGFNCPADVGIVGGTGPVSAQLYEAVRNLVPVRTSMDWIQEAAGCALMTGQNFFDGFGSEHFPMNPGRLAFEVSRFLCEEGRDWTLVIDGGDSAMWMNAAAKAHRPGQILTYGPNGTLGVGPGFALGAWAANEKPVLYFTGDGSFGFYPMEFDTFRRHGVPVTAVVCNNSAWGLIKLAECLIHPDQASKGDCGLEIGPRLAYEKMASVWDGYGRFIDRPDQLGPAMREGFASGRPSIINAAVDPEVMSPIIKMFGEMFEAA